MASVDAYHTCQGKMFRARVRRNGQTHTKVFATCSEANQWARAQESLVLAGMTTPLVKKASYTLDLHARETRLYKTAPVNNNLVLAYVGQHVLGMPRSS